MEKIPTDLIDPEAFGQILEMDDEDDRDFSKAIVYEFFTQAETTFKEIDENLKAKNLQELSSLGHFLKGSSATLGLVKIKDECEAIQNLGAGYDDRGLKKLNNDEESLKRIQSKLSSMKDEYSKVKGFLDKFYS